MKTKEKLFLVTTLALSLAGMILQAVLLGWFYQPELRLYEAHALPLTALFAVVAVACVVCLGASFALKIAGERKLPKKNNAVLFFGVLCALFAAASFVFSAVHGVTTADDTLQNRMVDIGVFACSLLFAGYFFLSAFSARPNVTVHSVLGMGAMAWSVFAAVETYFDLSYAVASPVRIFRLLGLLALLLFLTTEVRCVLGQGKRGQYIASAGALVFFAVAIDMPMALYGIVFGGQGTLIYCIGIAAGGYALARMISMMKTKEDEKMEYTFTYYDTLAEVDWDAVPKAMIDKFGWGYEYRPLCYARGVYAADIGLVVKLTAHEQNPCATRTEFMDDVCNDSCLEFFFAGDDTSAYANFEFNALGTQHTSAGAPGARSSIDKVTEIPYDKAEIMDDRWELTLVLTPKNVKDITGKELKRGAIFHGNFYKCGDECEQRHYGMWSEVDYEKPSFHQPQFFGDFIIG